MTNAIIYFFLCLIFVVCVNATSNNISCYQCLRSVNEECLVTDLKPCPAVFDRCVTHISKNDKGFTIRRECGLGPCGFDDLMANKGLGMDNCDQSQDEYFCIFCCQGNGCNQNTAFLRKPHFVLILIVLLLNIYNRYQPPYVLERYDNV
ncbi:hypothetical protein FQA39_LY08599 [Lamprigera yunnana]|nr:hypothetical protein FQA39_LY08599 [Lamprigera yunnana]